MANRETTPLIPPSPASAHKYYFLAKEEPTYTGGTTSAVKDTDGGLVVEDIPSGAKAEEFAPRVVAQPNMASPRIMSAKQKQAQQQKKQIPPKSGGIFSFLKGKPSDKPAKKYGDIGTLVKPRKAPIKVEPKVFFANERTFLAWLHLSIILAGASIAILAFADSDTDNPLSQLYGIMLLPVAVAFIVYSMYQYANRAYMIRNRLPGPYEDTVGPTVLATMLMLSIIAQFSLKLYAMQMT